MIACSGMALVYHSCVYQAIMEFTRPLLILLGHYGSAIMGCASQVI